MADWSEELRPLLFVCALLIAPALAAWDAWTYIALTTDGVTVQGVVTGKTRTYARRTDTYSVTYRFRDASGRSWTGTQSIDETRYESLRFGQRIDVVYSRSRPDWSVAYMSVLRERVAVLSLVSLVICIIAGALSWWWHYARTKTLEHDAEIKRASAA